MCQLVGGRLLHRHVSATDVGAVKAPTIQRSYSCKRSRQSVSTLQSQSSRSTALMPPARCSSAASEASRRPGVLPEIASMSGWDRGLRLVALLVARAPSTRPFGAVDAAGLREALRQASEE